MPNYVFEVFNYPKMYKYATQEEKENYCLITRLKLREALEDGDNGYVYSFWPDTFDVKRNWRP